MDIDEFDPRQKKPKLKDLGIYSVVELEEYVAMLAAKIARAKDMMASKKDHKNEAAKFFKN